METRRDADPVERTATAAVAITVSGLVTLLGTFGPWLRSGSSRRSSFELLQVVDRLGFASGGLFDWAVRAWPVVPLLIVAAIVAGWSRRVRWATWLSAVSGTYTCAVAMGVRQAPNAGLIRTDWGVTVALLGSFGLVASAVAVGVHVTFTRGLARRRRP